MPRDGQHPWHPLPGENLISPYNSEPPEADDERRRPPPPPLTIVPVPTPTPTPQPTTYPRTGNFPRGPAANDPIAKPKIRLGRWPLIIIELLKQIAEAQIRREIEEAKEADRKAEEQRKADEQEREVIINDPVEIPDPEIPPRPTFDPWPAFPRSPANFPDPVTPDMPSTFPDQTPVIRPMIPTFPLGLPGRSPFPPSFPSTHPSNPVVPISPSINPWSPFSPSPAARPSSTPAHDPALQPLSDLPLTPVGPGSVVSPYINQAPSLRPQLNLNPDKCPQRQRRCKEDTERRTECFKKIVFERSFPKWDREVDWAEIDCVTGREL